MGGGPFVYTQQASSSFCHVSVPHTEAVMLPAVVESDPRSEVDL